MRSQGDLFPGWFFRRLLQQLDDDGDILIGFLRSLQPLQ